MLGAALLALGLVACASPAGPRAATGAPAVETNVPYEIIRRKESYQVDGKLRSVRIVNRYGDLRVRMSDRHELGVSAVIQRIGSPGRDPDFNVQQAPGQIHFEVKYPGDDPRATVDFTRGRVDLVVFVQRGASIDAETGAGVLEVRRAQGPVKASTTSGKLSASSAAPLKLRSSTGDIYARQMSATMSGDTTIASGSGNIELGVPSRGNFVLQLEAGRGVSITDDWKAGEMARPVPGEPRFEYSMGTGAHRIVATTAGKVQLSPVILLDQSPGDSASR